VLLGETRAVIRGPEFRSVLEDAVKVAVASLQEAMQVRNLLVIRNGILRE
jgi:hypothetical protein